ncbi:PP2C family protein-serine/threonine phosphatase [Antarctobacter heliothermus]|uniref:Serine/threonine protein phosphatase PrpC n=1 Tax=Antarctobacter heliothermus TaxID=74033 RepID=A0A239IJW8_9RHOB|nr:protein phosphatase 2C domain-containing protein [Antarctobacter heliothermus]SNS93333.1 Serine/threonine protein phosphatase PrpC [Antarctobacter heliothermus]
MTDLVAEAASGQYIGARSRQEDAVIAQFPQGDMPGVAVLSDGMGGHDDGDLAGRILASEMFGEMYLAAARPDRCSDTQGEVFRAALERTNARLKQHIDAGYISADTGGTLVCVTVEGRALRWMSVGDSPLYLFRDGQLKQLNQLHSMAIQLDLMVKNGAMEASAAAQHPHRHCLTSAVTGGQVPHVDCPADALTLEPGDTVVLASDGLNVLSETEIALTLRRTARKGSMAMTRALLDAVCIHKAPQQDNVTLVVIHVAPVVSPSLSGARIASQLAGLARHLFPIRSRALRAEGRRAGP